MLFKKTTALLIFLFLINYQCSPKIIRKEISIGEKFPLIILSDQYGGLASSGKFSQGKWIFIGNNYKNGYMESKKWQNAIGQIDKSWKIKRLWSLEFLPFYKPSYCIIRKMNKENPHDAPLTLFIDKNGRFFNLLGMKSNVDNLYFIENGIIKEKFSDSFNKENFQKIKELLAK